MNTHIKTVTKYIRRSPYQSVAATLLMTLTFFTISIFMLLTLFSARFINYLESSPQLTVFFQDDASGEEINAMKREFEATGKTLSVKYISKEEALKIYNKQNENNPRLLELVTADILPASLEVQASRADYLEDLAKIAEGDEVVEEIIYQKDIVDRLIVWVNALRMIGAVFIVVLLVASVFVIVIVTGIKITIRKDEIETMRLIGATNWFIRSPFLLEGMFYGALGAMIGFGIAAGILWYVTPLLSDFFRGVPIFPLPPLVLAELFGIELFAACALGVLSSYIAVLRYLK